MRNRKYQNRRGITLLFVVSMIVLFLLMGTTFVVVSNDYLRASKKRAIHNVHLGATPSFVEQAFFELVRGPELTNTTSPLRGQDLLSDQYGYGFSAYVSETTMTGTLPATPRYFPSSDNQYIQIAIASKPPSDPTYMVTDLNQAWDLLTPESTMSNPLTNVGGVYDGLVISFVSGYFKGVSTRVTQHTYEPTSGNHYFTFPAVEGGLTPAALVDSKVIFNGRDFSGTGAGGYTAGAASTPRLTTQALAPNRIGQTITAFRNTYLGTAGARNRAPNESYDAADYQNMFLAGRDTGGTLIPSFHRPSLVGTDMSAGGIGNRAAFSAFADSGVNPRLIVDTNNDGAADAIWLDTGMPIQTGDDGTYYKPLVAYTVVDLDGRLNVNAHGNLTQANPADNNFINSAFPVAMLDAGVILPRGQGWGPAEISIASSVSDYPGILAERYGADGVPGDGGTYGWSRGRLFGHPFAEVEWTNDDHGTVGNLFASSYMDLHGRFAIGIPATAAFDSSLVDVKDRFVDLNDPGSPGLPGNPIAAGDPGFPNAMPVMDMLFSTFAGEEFSNSPYEMSFAPSPFNDRNDTPFHALELEGVFRASDPDSGLLPDRLADFIPAASVDRITTDSYEVPMTFESVLAKLRLRIWFEANGATTPIPPIPPLDTTVPAEIAQLLALETSLQALRLHFAPELFRGLKMNVNRPLGNGYDGADADFVVDNPGEETTEVNTDYRGYAMDLNNDGIFNGADANARTDLAKHLYMLALLICDQDTAVLSVDLDGDGTADPNGFEISMAQWAINTVDFRDPDSIMTRFDFDVNPWDGWDTAGMLTVWGCERPELLITETLAAHQRRTEDLAADGMLPGDNDLDQGLRPEPFAYFELYNPWTQNSINQQFDSSLYDAVNQGVALDRVSGGANPSPVWRIVISRPSDADRDDADYRVREQNLTDLRFVYFTDPGSGGADTITDDNGPNIEVFYSTESRYLRPGTQAIVGTLGHEDPNNADHYRSFFGRQTAMTLATEGTSTLLDTTNHIDIDTTTGEVTAFPAEPLNGGVRTSVFLPIDMARDGDSTVAAAPRSFSISDPFGGYNAVDANGDPYVSIADGFRYTVPYDTPFDQTPDNRNTNALDIDDIYNVSDGLAESFRVARLQRLANPLNVWHAANNPYITVDSSHMDLVTMNGASSVADPMAAATALESNGANSLERGNMATDEMELWSNDRLAANAAAAAGSTAHYFNVTPQETLGRVNQSYYASTGTSGFPWLTWNNRPYISHLELTNVPHVSPENLTSSFSVQNNAKTFVDDADPYGGYDGTSLNELHGLFGHLLNFFSNDSDSGVGRNEADMYKIMDFLEVPSRFLGTEGAMEPTDVARHPFDYIPRYRVPGKININTVYDAQVWNGLQGDYGTLGGGVSFAEWQTSRQGGGGINEFHNPWRPNGTGNYVPPGVGLFQGPDCTLFRDDGASVPVFDFASGSDADDTNRSAYFRNAQRTRLGNLITNRSSVFAVWITVGYFEVDPSAGFALRDIATGGKEVGNETGNVQRSRGFYIYDRSIPVAYEPGQNHNIDRGILVQSIIE